MNVLMIRYRLDCTLQFDHGLPVIYIKAHSMPLLRSIVLEHMDPSMLYKLGIKPEGTISAPRGMVPSTETIKPIISPKMVPPCSNVTSTSSLTVDGDGSFQVNHWKQKILQFRIVIKLKNTPANVQLLQLIKAQLGVGNVYIDTISVLFQIDSQKEIASILHIFTIFCFHMRSLLTYAEFHRLKQDFVLMPSVLSTTAILNLSYFSVWLVGFTTAEGCFSIRLSGYHSFSISQTYDQSLPNLVRFILAKSEPVY
ncbi:hypothetical protein BC938DRAFT_481696 [Jimgerdemannia flammicorona]|uniref:Homing endonuclease LAGLIDADG domain-containing protein n=1 Tax=Jimgerdemannia flammicorona TaxID=994334 RepID=A0A433QFN0_9FUNG|nr:hypothetical protein BC938DRAFT_481696 [Jimgerdemannia flammicorona]